MRPIWSGMIGFGLVNIPVKLYVGSEETGLNFDMLRRKDNCRIGYVRVCKETGEEVPYKDIVKGFEVHKGEYVLMEEEDFEKANVEKTQTIEVVEFVNEGEVDLKYIERPYYLEPEKKAAKAYALFREAIKKSKMVGIVKFVVRSREHLGMLRAEGKGIVLLQMRFADEVRSMEDLSLPAGEKISPKEMELATELIEQLKKPFKPEQFKDTYTKNLKELIEEKAQGKKPKARGHRLAPTPVPDLMSKLRQSLKTANRG